MTNQDLADGLKAIATKDLRFKTAREADARICELRQKLDVKPRSFIFNVRAANQEIARLEELLPPSPPAVTAPVVAEQVAEPKKPLSLDAEIRARQASPTVSPEVEPLRAAIAAAKPGLDKEAMEARLERITAPVAATGGGDHAAEIAQLEARISKTPDGMTKDCLIDQLAKLKN